MNQNSYVSFSNSDQSDYQTLAEWLKSLERDPGGRACLRRSRSPDEVAFCPSYHDLLRRLRAAGYEVGPGTAQRIAPVAGLAAHVKQPNSKMTLASQMATASEGQSRAIVSGLRFRRLLEKREAEHLYLPLMRAVKMLDGNCNLLDLARSVYWWNDATRQQWAYRYYETAPNEA